MLNKIKALLFDDFVIKVFSLIFAVVLWFHVVAKGKSEVNFVVPLELKDIPKDMVVVGDPPGYVDVRLLGQEGILKSLSPKDLGAAVSMTGAKEGESVYYLGPANMNVPGNIAVTSVKPPEIRLRLEAVTERTLTVVPVISGKPARGYRLDKVDVVPEKVSVRGPKSLLSRLEDVHTKAVDITGATGSMDRAAKLDIPAIKGVYFEQDSVDLQVTLTKAKR